MSSKDKNLSEYTNESIPDASEMKMGVVVSDWNSNITTALKKGCLETLVKHGMLESNIKVIHVPGTYELTSGASMLGSSDPMDGIICLGCVVKGETRHDEYINSAVANGLTILSINMNKPVIFGVLTVENMEQALDRAGGKHGNKGVESAITAIKMVELHRNIKGHKNKIGF